MTVDTTETETEIGTGWTTAMIALAAPELAVEAEVRFASVIENGSGSEMPQREKETASVTIGTSIADEIVLSLSSQAIDSGSTQSA